MVKTPTSMPDFKRCSAIPRAAYSAPPANSPYHGVTILIFGKITGIQVDVTNQLDPIIENCYLKSAADEWLNLFGFLDTNR